METLVNPDYIRRANSASHFDAGDGIEREANDTLSKFDAEFPTDGLTDEQKHYLDERRAQWREFVVTHYNDHCRRRAEYMPVTVCGPARYPARQVEKKVDRIMALSGEFAEKVERFLNNTRKHLENLVPLETQFENLRAGKWHRGETIPANDPHVTDSQDDDDDPNAATVEDSPEPAAPVITVDAETLTDPDNAIMLENIPYLQILATPNNRMAR